MANSFTFERNISIYPGEDYNGKPIKKLVFTGHDIENVPAELFKLKISASKKPELAGSVMTRYVSWKLNAQLPWSSKLPNTINMQTPVDVVKNELVNVFRQYPEAVFSVSIKMPGQFGNIETPQGTYSIFDFKVDPIAGNVGYYLVKDTPVTVTLTLAENKGNDYFRVALATTKSPDEIFRRSGHAKVWGAEETTVSSFGATSSFDAPTPTGGFAGVATPTFDSPVADFGAQSFGAPAQSFGAPAQGFGAPAQSFGAPAQGFDAQGFSAPGFQNPNNGQ